jgi:hypothetical protein
LSVGFTGRVSSAASFGRRDSAESAAELHRQFRMVVDAAWYRDLFPTMRAAKDSGTKLVTTAGGSRYATRWAAPLLVAAPTLLSTTIL